MKRMIFILTFVAFLNCSEDSASTDDTMPTLDLSIISGRYVGTWDWELGTGDISMEIAARNQNDFSVAFFETSNFRPMFNSDGMTPEARGTLQVIGNEASIALTLNTDQPDCTGNYTGTGTRTEDGRLTLTMNIRHDCAQDGEARWSLIKINDLN